MNHKNPVLAGLLNLVFPGLGAAYLGEWGSLLSELLEVVVFVVFWIFGGFLLSLLDNSERLLYFNIAFLAIYGLAMFLDGRQAAQVHNRKAQAA